jgi:hypothetical protein
MTDTDADIREKLAHIDRMLADHDRRRRGGIRLAWSIFVAGMVAAAGLIGATVAVATLLLRAPT